MICRKSGKGQLKRSDRIVGLIFDMNNKTEITNHPTVLHQLALNGLLGEALDRYGDDLGLTRETCRLLDKNGRTVWHNAAIALEAADELSVWPSKLTHLLDGKEILTQDNNGFTVLHYLAKNSTQLGVHEFLGEAGKYLTTRDIEHKNKLGENFIQCAINNGNVGSVSHYIRDCDLDSKTLDKIIGQGALPSLPREVALVAAHRTGDTVILSEVERVLYQNAMFCFLGTKDSRGDEEADDLPREQNQGAAKAQ
jgi:hypothetical protein